jgi:predicted DNA-binding transcriptional regulator AlpA
MMEPPKPLRDDLLTATVQAPTFLTAHDIAQLCRVSASTVSRWAKGSIGDFPQPLVKEGTKLHLFLTADYVQWVAAKAAKRDGVPMPVDARTMKRRRYG